jgi:hypothetical protein
MAETVALAAWSCTLPAEHPALYATAHVLGVVSKRRFEESRAAGWAEASRESVRAFDAEMAELVTLLRLMVGNPFAPVAQG